MTQSGNRSTARKININEETDQRYLMMKMMTQWSKNPNRGVKKSLLKKEKQEHFKEKKREAAAKRKEEAKSKQKEYLAQNKKDKYDKHDRYEGEGEGRPKNKGACFKCG